MAGEFPALLEKDGQAENAALVLWSDLGLGMPHGKRWIDDIDTGIIADLVLLKAIKSGGKPSAPAKPSIDIIGSNLPLRCQADESSIAYPIKRGD